MEKNTIKKSKNRDLNEAELIDAIIIAMQEKKANNIVRLDLEKLNKSVCSSFIISDAESTVQVKAIADNIEEEVFKKLKIKVWRRQGDENALWIILDYGSIVVHIFQTECRGYYALEDLWADADITNIAPENKIA